MVNRKRLVDNFIKLALIRSFSGEEKDVAMAVIEELRSMGFTDDCINIDAIGNIHVLLPGNTESLAPVVFCCHMDTVKPGERIMPVIRNGIISTDGTSILGADDKAGIAAVLEMLRILIEKQISHGDIEIIFTVMEENGMTGSKSLTYANIRSRIAYVADGSMRPGLLTTASPYKNRIRIAVEGKASHAGVNPGKGISAIQVAAKAIAVMKLLNVDESTTANIGTIEGGISENIVCADIHMKAEVRSHNPKMLECQTAHMRECFENAASECGAEVDFTAALLYPGYSIGEDEYIVRRFRKACGNAGLQFGTCKSGGGSDANIFNSLGIKAAVVGIGVQNPHSTNEYIPVKDLTDTSALLIELAGALGL